MSATRRKIAVGLGVLGLIVLLGGGWPLPAVVAQAPKAEFKLKLMGINRTLDPWKLYEEWARTVEARTNGRVQFELTSLPELGLGGAETLRVLRTGVVDVTETYGGYVAGELPMVEILELPGIFPDPQTAKKAILAWKPTETKLLDQKANAVLLAMAVYPDQAFFSKKAVRKPADFKGLKTRVHSVALASLVAGLGGEPLHHRLRGGLHGPGARHPRRGHQRHQARLRPPVVRSLQVPGRPHLHAPPRGPGHQQEQLEAAAP